MDQGSLVDSQRDEGRELIKRLAQNHFDVTAAFWVKVLEDGQWLFYIASKAVDDVGIFEAYKQVHAIMRSMPHLDWIGGSDLKLIGATNPITKAVLDFLSQYPAKIPTIYRGTQLGNVNIDQAYIYEPAPAA